MGSYFQDCVGGTFLRQMRQVAVCALGKAEGAPASLQELSGVFNSWHASVAGTSGEASKQPGTTADGKAGSLAGWPGVKHVKAVGGKEWNSKTAMTRLLASLK